MAMRQEALAARIPFSLPPELEAREPAEVRGRGRDDVRLLVTTGPHGESRHARFVELAQFLRAGDLVVFNSSATVPSRLPALAPSGQTFWLHVSTRLPNGLSVVEPRAYSPRCGESASLPGEAALTFLECYRESHRLWTARFTNIGGLIEYLYRWGKPIAYKHVTREWPIEAYQTVYANEAGSAEMPSAGRPFTREVLHGLRAAGIDTAFVALHTGVSSPERDEAPYEEQFRVPAETAASVNRTHRNGGSVIAVGTTVVRALESASHKDGSVAAASGWTDLVSTPQRGLHAVDGMITGFHEPRSSHLALLEALAGSSHVDAAYDAAVAARYLWHEFGDSHLLLP